jgi:transposase
MESEQKQKPRRKRRKFTPEFKAGATRLVLEEGKSITQVGRDLDVNTSVVGHWVKQAKVDAGRGPPGALTTAERERLRQLEKENRVLRMERDILSKATAFFAKENA